MMRAASPAVTSGATVCTGELITRETGRVSARSAIRSSAVTIPIRTPCGVMTGSAPTSVPAMRWRSSPTVSSGAAWITAFCINCRIGIDMVPAVYSSRPAAVRPW